MSFFRRLFGRGRNRPDADPIQDDPATMNDPELDQEFLTHSMRCAICATRSCGARCPTWQRILALRSSPLFSVCTSDDLTLDSLREAVESSVESDAAFVAQDGKTPFSILLENSCCTSDHVRIFLEKFPDFAWGPFESCLWPRRFALAKVFFDHFGEEVQTLHRARIVKCVTRFVREGPIEALELFCTTFGKDEVLKALGNPFIELFSMRSEQQREIFSYLVDLIGDEKTVRRMLSKPGVLKSFCLEAQDEYGHADLLREIHGIIGPEMFRGRGGILHWISESWLYGNQEVFASVLDLVDDETLRRLCRSHRSSSPLWNMLNSDSLNHYDDDRGLASLRLLLSRLPELVTEDDLKMYVQIGARHDARDSTKVLRVLKVLLEAGGEEMCVCLGSEYERPLREAGHDLVIDFLRTHGAAFAAKSFFNLASQFECTFDRTGTVVQSQFDYGAVLSSEGFSEGIHSCVFEILKLGRQDGLFVGVTSPSSIRMNVYLGNSSGGVAFRSNGDLFAERQEQEGFALPFGVGDRIELTMDFASNSLRLSFLPGGQRGPVSADLPSARPLHFGLGLMQGSKVRFHEEK